MDEVADVPSPDVATDVAALDPVSEDVVLAVATAPPLVRAEPVAPALPMRPLLDLARGRLDEEGAAEIGLWLPTAGSIGIGLFVGCALCGLAVVAYVWWRRYQRQR